MKFLPILLLVGCAPAPFNISQDHGPNNIDPAFQSLYTQFIDEANDAGVYLNVNQGVTIRFQDITATSPLGEVIGDSSTIGYGNATITIDPTFWNSNDIVSQQVLLFHELGHGVLDEIHTTNQMAIMNALINYPMEYEATDLSGMVNQLFLSTGSANN